MPKKKTSRRRVSKTQVKRITFLIISSIVFVFGAVLFTKANEFVNPPCANSISCITDLSGKYETESEATFMGKVVNPNFQTIAYEPTLKTQVLGENTEEKRIEVDLSKQRLYAYQGEELVYEFPVATGKWGRTPTGEFKIWIKLLYTRMSGGSGNDYYNLPNVPYTMFFYNDEVPKSRGFALHGAYWHNNYGYPMSHGCVNIRPEDAALLYEWATPVNEGNTTYASADNPGTTVKIYGETPNF